MVLVSIFADKVHLRPSTGIDWSAPRNLRDVIDISITKLAGLWATWALIAFLYGIDDSGVEHRVYPKDLVAYARERVKKTHSQPPVPAGQPCPKAGYWFSPAQQNSRRYFKQGELMPEFKGSSWGATIWYWSSES